MKMNRNESQTRSQTRGSATHHQPTDITGVLCTPTRDLPPSSLAERGRSRLGVVSVLVSGLVVRE